MRYAILALLAAGACTGAADPPAETQTAEPQTEGDMSVSVSSVSFTSIDGEPLPMSSFDGQVVLVVNTASKCGYTPQYEGLQSLSDKYEAQGFTVLGVPSNDFGGQEPGTEEEIKTFCEINFGVDFPLTAKVHAIGPKQHDFWKVAKSGLGESAEPKWNFHKVLVSKSGEVLKAYPSSVTPLDDTLMADIEGALAS
ncbi:MAG: glutathione peroxidase [Henriciella sp.]